MGKHYLAHSCQLQDHVFLLDQGFLFCLQLQLELLFCFPACYELDVLVAQGDLVYLLTGFFAFRL